MLAILIRLFGTIGTLVTCSGTVLSLNQCPFWLWWICVIATPSCVALVAFDIYVAWKQRPRTFRPKSPDIEAYMGTWLKSGGKTVIFSRDMSWAQAHTMTGQALIEKAKDKSLDLFVENPTLFVQQLQTLGAAVYRYPSGFTPKSRFTILNHGKVGARVAVGYPRDGKHVIEEHDIRGDLAVVYDDLVSIAQKTSTRL